MKEKNKPADCVMNLALPNQDDSRALQYEEEAMKQKGNGHQILQCEGTWHA